MNDITAAAPPLTRRQAREIERRTGQRPVAVAQHPATFDLAATESIAAQNFVHDTSRIERNDVTSLISVMPTEMLERDAVDAVLQHGPDADLDAQGDHAVAGAAFIRPTSIRAARPAALVARSRRRSILGVGVAASAAVLASATAVTVPGVVAEQNEQQAASAALVTADTIADDNGQVSAPGAETATATTDLVAAPETAPDRADYSVASITPEVVEEAVTAAATSTGTSTGGGTATAATNGGGGGYGDLNLTGIAATAESWIGSGHGMSCDAFTRAVYAEHGITLGVGVSAQAAQGVPTSNPQPGDLVVWPGEHIGIYAGNNLVIDNPGYGGNPVKIREIWGNPYYVTLNG